MIGFVVNPVSGNGQGRAVWQKVESILEEHKTSYTVRFTSAAGDATRLTTSLADDPQCEIVIAVGGDGTVGEVVNGLAQAGRSCVLGHIPAGTGNDFARGHGIPLDHIDALRLILSAPAFRPVDLLLLGQHIAVNSIGVGFDGEVVRLTNQSRSKRWLNRLGLGKLIYALSTLRVLARYKPSLLSITVDGREEQCRDSWVVAVTNIPYYAGSMMICPQAVPDDGLANVMVVTGRNRLKLLPILLMVYKGRHLSHPAVRFFSGRAITIRPDAPQLVHADGDLLGEFPVIEVKVRSDWLRVCK
ncbi:diacylglycerol kinase family lipid kinase [Brevibacillus humidisoli]|uniref:diacylglycerol/lipid kinase family protein n=1 Tax=Brevibacillus humidisoli TaxID=2895522 RepID=UPI001E4F26FF|nr:diacylglycerol kinase family protein [Brevibacillus humidisoli]UFJ39521.1 diacylglycerol kinase family lipid kinase [Brevibacillus humidisoli]